MSYREHLPHPALQPYVDRFWTQVWPRVVPERTTPYGAREIIVQDPAGHVVFFAAHTAT